VNNFEKCSFDGQLLTSAVNCDVTNKQKKMLCFSFSGVVVFLQTHVCHTQGDSGIQGVVSGKSLLLFTVIHNA
jgi:hypothetical protein